MLAWCHRPARASHDVMSHSYKMALQLKACTSCCSNLNPAKRLKAGRQQEQPSQADLAISARVSNDGGSWSSDEDDEGCTAVAELEAEVQHLHEQVVILGQSVSSLLLAPTWLCSCFLSVMSRLAAQHILI